MELGEFGLIIGTAIASMGGAGAIILVASKWIGQIWADKMSQSFQHQYDRQLEEYRNQLQIYSSAILRYSGEQFKLYNNLCHSLFDLKKSADALWDIASKQKLQVFSKQLMKTSDEIEKNYLLLEQQHYDQLNELLTPLKEYEIGKTNLIRLRQQNMNNVNNEDIDNLIHNNEDKKRNYERLLNNIRDDFRRQIRGER